MFLMRMIYLYQFYGTFVEWRDSTPPFIIQSRRNENQYNRTYDNRVYLYDVPLRYDSLSKRRRMHILNLKASKCILCWLYFEKLLCYVLYKIIVGTHILQN